MHFKTLQVAAVSHPTINLRCPACRHLGTFQTLGQSLSLGNAMVGHAACPNHSCRTHVFFVLKNDGQLLAAYPPERIDFDATDVPAPVVGALEEAIACHASQCFVASAIMVRRTLEEICHDRGAQGANLKDRITSLGSQIVISKELLDGLDDLRLLGNDAAHIESVVFVQVGKEEVELAIAVTKEVLKAVYQQASLVKRLKDRKMQPSGNKP
jgi:hypothetical protein